jgi:hypothetical protein
MTDMNQEKAPDQESHEMPVTVHVNTKPVRLDSHRATGLQIKQAAINQGVTIQLDFVLLELLGHNRTKEVRDNETITVTDKSEFDAIPNDDHSREVG